MLAILIINHGTATATGNCLTGLMPELPGDAMAMLLDNGSDHTDSESLKHAVAKFAGRIQLECSDRNLGFAAGMNHLLRNALAKSDVDQVLLLNSDTQATPGFIRKMQAALEPISCTDMVAATMLDANDGQPDSLGITLYRSTLASNRKREQDILLGPSGGCALFTRRLLEDLRSTHGEWFDETFFCYAEDTDLVLRARWLGYLPAYAEDAIVYHERSLSSGGPENDFVLYHGIRNSLWWLVKCAPAGWFLRSLPWFVALHAGICLRHLRRGKARILWRLYRDAWRGLPEMRKKRAIIKRTRRVQVNEFRHWVQPQFYEPGYVRRAWRELWSPRRRSPPPSA